MPTIGESSVAPGNLAASLAAGVDSISQSQTVEFVRYNRVVLPLDGFIFWVRADLAVGAAANAALGPFISISSPSIPPDPSVVLTAFGSLHYAADQAQEEDGSPTINNVTFTTTEQIDDMVQVGGTTMYIGTFNGIRFAFNNHANFYRQSGLWHYRGRAVLSVMESQIIDTAEQLNSLAKVVSNSLPIWMSLGAGVTVYPSFAIPSNEPPPYVAVHVEPASTTALQQLPFTDQSGTRWQLVSDRVRFTMYGLDNSLALDFVQFVCDASLADNAAFGVMTLPVVADERRTQTELQVLAQKKTVVLDVSYYQARMQTITTQLILHAIMSCNFAP